MNPSKWTVRNLTKHFGVNVESHASKVTGKHDTVQFSGNTDTDPVACELLWGATANTRQCRRVVDGFQLFALVGLMRQSIRMDRSLCASGMHWKALSRRRQKKVSFCFVGTVCLFRPSRRPENKLLMFRAEWSGTRSAGDGIVCTFRPPTAGHPHWHFDALSSLVAKTGERQETEVFRSPQCRAPNCSRHMRPNPINQVLKPNIDRIHFASGATWWKSASAHIHAPKNPTELEAWASGCAMYIKDELRSLSRRGIRDH